MYALSDTRLGEFGRKRLTHYFYIRLWSDVRGCKVMYALSDTLLGEHGRNLEAYVNLY